MNDGYVVMGRPHPSHSFIELHPTVCEIVHAIPKKFRGMKFWQMRNQYLQDEEVDCSSHRMRAFVWILKVSIGFSKFRMEFPGGT